MLKYMKRKVCFISIWNIHLNLDDILPKLMTSTGSYEDLYRKEIAKYNHICEEISQNLQAQEQLLIHIQGQNRQFAGTFNIEDYKAACEKCYKHIEAAVAKYREIKENINEGLKFYVTLQDAITSVKQQCSDFVMTRSIQCREMIEDVQRQMSGLSFQDGKNSSNNNNNYNYSSTAPPPQRTSSQPESATQPPYYHHHQQQPPAPPPAYAQAQHHPPPPQQQPPYGGPQQPPPPYHGGSPYPPAQQGGGGQQPPGGYEYGQPAYPGWQGQYYNARAQQPGSFPRPPYTAPNTYPPPNQSGYYK